jgi:hypothetical protein
MDDLTYLSGNYKKEVVKSKDLETFQFHLNHYWKGVLFGWF